MAKYRFKHNQSCLSLLSSKTLKYFTFQHNAQLVWWTHTNQVFVGVARWMVQRQLLYHRPFSKQLSRVVTVFRHWEGHSNSGCRTTECFPISSFELCNILVAYLASCSRASYFHKIWRGNHIGIQNGRPLALLIEEENPIFELKECWQWQNTWTVEGRCECTSNG